MRLGGGFQSTARATFFAGFFVRISLVRVRRVASQLCSNGLFDLEGRVESENPGYMVISSPGHGCLGGHGVQVDDKFKVRSPGS